MTTAIANQSNISLKAIKLSIIAIITYQIVLVALIFIRPDLDPYWHPISEWALGKYGWIMVMAFLMSSCSYAALFVGLRTELKGVLSKIGWVILALCALCTFGVGIFKTDQMAITTIPNPPPPVVPSTTGMLHIMCGSSALFLLPFAALCINFSLAFKNPAYKTSKKTLIWSGILPIIGLIGFITHTVIYLLPLGDYAYGPEVPLGYPVRLLFLSYMIWLITVAVQVIKVNKAKF
jgi:hypothetical protein